MRRSSGLVTVLATAVASVLPGPGAVVGDALVSDVGHHRRGQVEPVVQSAPPSLKADVATQRDAAAAISSAAQNAQDFGLIYLE